MKTTDAMVAEKVMGWHRYGSEWLNNKTDRYEACADYAFDDHFTPTTDIAQAFQVVERMLKLGFLSYRVTYNAYTKTHSCRFFNDDGSSCDSGQSDTPAMAICKAAYKATQ